MDLCGINLISYMHTVAAWCVLFSTCSAPRPAAPPQPPQLLEHKIPISVYFQQISLCLSHSSSTSLALAVPFSSSLFQALQLDISQRSRGTPMRNGVTGRAPL